MIKLLEKYKLSKKEKMLSELEDVFCNLTDNRGTNDFFRIGFNADNFCMCNLVYANSRTIDNLLKLDYISAEQAPRNTPRILIKGIYDVEVDGLGKIKSVPIIKQGDSYYSKIFLTKKGHEELDKYRISKGRKPFLEEIVPIYAKKKKELKSLKIK